MDRWSGKVAMVTGVSSGIGAATAEALVKEGLQVVGLARRIENIEGLAEKLSEEAGKLHPFKVDLTNEEDIIDAFRWTLENLGPISILINCAGTLQINNLIDGDTESWRTIFETNVLGLCAATREAVSTMIKCGIDGHIIHLGSCISKAVPNTTSIPGSNVYPASKAAVETLAESLRQELNRICSKIKVTCINPGFVKTEMLDNIQGEDIIPEDTPVLNPEDVASAIIYVLSTASNCQVSNLVINPIGQAS